MSADSHDGAAQAVGRQALLAHLRFLCEQIELEALRRLFEASEALRMEALTGVTDEVLLVTLRDMASEVALGEAARRLREDRSNLHRMVYGKRRLSRRVRLGIGKLVRERLANP